MAVYRHLLSNHPDRGVRKMRVIGYLEAYTDNILVGWAYNPAEPKRRLLLGVEVDGEPVAAGIAHLDRQDVAHGGHGDGQCGFRILVSIDAGQPFLVREASSGTILFTQDDLPVRDETALASDTSLIRGNVDTVLGTNIKGWCWHPHAPDRAVRVCALVDGREVCATDADEMRGDLINAGIGNGQHAFSLPMPFWMLDGVTREVSVVAEGYGPLPGSPVSFSGLTEGARPLLSRLLAIPDGDETSRQGVGLLLDCYLRHVETLLPRSVGFAYYADWYRAQAGEISLADWPAELPERALRLKAPDGSSYLLCVDEGVVPFANAAQRLLSLAVETGADIVYVDMQVTRDGKPFPWFRPAWSPDLALAQDYMRGVTLIREEVLARQGQRRTLAGMRYGAMLSTDPARIVRLPEVLGSLERPPAQAVSMDIAQLIATCLYGRAEVEIINPEQGLRRIRWGLPAIPPRISLIIPTRDRLNLLRTAVDSIRQRTRYPNYEILIIDNQSEQPETLAWLEAGKHQGHFRVLPYDAPFNYADMNNLAAAQAEGDILGFINNDVELITPDWLETAIGLLARPEVGAIGARLRFANDMLQHGGVVVGTGGLAENAFQHVGVADEGYFHRTQVAGNYSAVTAACLFIRRADFQALGGFDADNLPVAFNDVDLCLRLREQGRMIVWTPHIDLYHYESVSRGRDDTPEKRARAMKEELYMRRRWSHLTMADPYYSPNLNLDGVPFTGLALPPRQAWGR